MDYKDMYCHLCWTITHCKFVGKLRPQIIEEINKEQIQKFKDQDI